MEHGGITIASGGLAVHQGGIQVLSSKVADILTLYMNSTNSFVGNVITVGGTQVRVHGTFLLYVSAGMLCFYPTLCLLFFTDWCKHVQAVEFSEQWRANG